MQEITQGAVSLMAVSVHKQSTQAGRVPQGPLPDGTAVQTSHVDVVPAETRERRVDEHTVGE